MRTNRLCQAAICLIVVSFASHRAMGQATFLGPAPYLSFADSPFNGPTFGYFHLETFEDLSLNTPGVSADQGTAINLSNNSSIDSVDGDDGSIDGSGANGASFFHPTSVTFTFDAGALGGLPTHVGIVWTDGTTNGLVTFEAFDALGVSLGTNSATLGDGAFAGQTAEDRFFGVIYAGGVSSFLITDNGSLNNLEVDHLQYGRLPVPEPASMAMAGVALAALVLRRR